jgi:hypothetical protein
LKRQKGRGVQYLSARGKQPAIVQLSCLRSIGARATTVRMINVARASQLVEPIKWCRDIGRERSSGIAITISSRTTTYTDWDPSTQTPRAVHSCALSRLRIPLLQSCSDKTRLTRSFSASPTCNQPGRLLSSRCRGSSPTNTGCLIKSRQ